MVSRTGLLSIEEEEWSYADALYFTWTTLTTIGYGDFTIENNRYITASLALIFLLAISFAAGSALVRSQTHTKILCRGFFDSGGI
jgi:hypothetical protein